MPTQRNGYGLLAYGDGDYGTSGSVIDGAASVSASSFNTIDADLVKLSGQVTIPAQGSVTASGGGTFASGALVSSTSVNTSVAEQFVLKESDMFSYGTGAYGYGVYDNADIQTIVSATAVDSSCTGERVQSSGASASVSCSATATPEKILQAEAQSEASVSATATAVFLISVSVSLSAESSTTATPVRKRNATALRSVTSSVSAIGREKWEAIEAGAQAWEPISTDAQSWDTIPETSITWSNVA